MTVTIHLDSDPFSLGRDFACANYALGEDNLAPLWRKKGRDLVDYVRAKMDGIDWENFDAGAQEMREMFPVLVSVAQATSEGGAAFRALPSDILERYQAGDFEESERDAARHLFISLKDIVENTLNNIERRLPVNGKNHSPAPN